MSLWKKLAGELLSGTAADIRMDNSTNGILSIDEEHIMAHEGEMFSILGTYQNLSSGTAGQIDFILSTPDTTKHVHMYINIFSNRKCHFSLWENPLVHVTGSVLNNYNMNRNHSTAANANWHVTGVSASQANPGGIILLGEHSVGATGLAGGGFGGGAENPTPWILKQNEDYLLRVLPQDADVTINYQFVWYEHVDKS